MSDPSLEEQIENYDDPAGWNGPDPDLGPEANMVGLEVSAITDLLSTLDVIFDSGPIKGADLETHARWLLEAREAKRQLGVLEQKIQDATAARMTGKTVVVEGLGVLSRHERKSRTQWDKDALKSAVLDSRLVDKSTGEVADEAPVDKILAVWNLGAPRVTALRARGIDADEFCVVERQPGWAVEVKGA